MNQNYEELVALGLPRLQKGYTYKFYIKNWKKLKPGYHTIYEHQWKNALHCDIRKMVWGIFPVKVAGAVSDSAGLGDPYAYNTNSNVRARGLATVDELYEPAWLPAHFVSLGISANQYWEKDIAEKEAEKLKNLELKNKKNLATSKTSKYLNRRMP